MTRGQGRASRGGHPAIILGNVMRYRTPVCWPAATASASGCNGQGCNGQRREGKGPWLGRGKREVGPAAGAKFIGSVAPITLISHRFECQTRRFFAILRDGPVRYGEEHGLGESTVQ